MTRQNETSRGREGERLGEWGAVKGRWKEKSLPSLEGHDNLCCLSGRIGKARREMDLILTEHFL